MEQEQELLNYNRRLQLLVMVGGSIRTGSKWPGPAIMHFDAARRYTLTSTCLTSMHSHALPCRVTHIDEYTRDEFLADLSERFTPQSYR